MASCGATHKRVHQDVGPAVLKCRHYHADPQICGLDRTSGGLYELSLSEAWRLMLHAGEAVGAWPLLSDERSAELRTCPDDWDAAFACVSPGAVPVR